MDKCMCGEVVTDKFFNGFCASCAIRIFCFGKVYRDELGMSLGREPKDRHRSKNRHRSYHDIMAYLHDKGQDK